MVQRVILDGLWCGQGMANMVRVYKDSTVDPATTPADWLCLFDFGSGGLSKTGKPWVSRHRSPSSWNS